MARDEFLTLAAAGEAETRVRGSRFHALASPASDESEARSILEKRERERFDASHHCAAWRFRDGSWRTLDAGEPSGSAGPPILAAIDAAGLADVAVIVTRYFGGTKLGVGGLVRAYGDAAAEAIGSAPRRRGIPALRLRLSYSYDLTAVVMRALERYGASEVWHGFAESSGEPLVDFSIPARHAPALTDFLREQSAGTLGAEVKGESVLYTRETG